MTFMSLTNQYLHELYCHISDLHNLTALSLTCTGRYSLKCLSSSYRVKGQSLWKYVNNLKNITKT